MIDLDAVWSEADELYCRFGVALCLGKIPYNSWKKFCYTYSRYRYVFPDNRFLNESLIDTIFTKTRKTGAEMVRFALLIGHLESHFTEQEQARMLSILISS